MDNGVVNRRQPEIGRADMLCVLVCVPLQATLRGSLRRAFGLWELLLFGIGIVIGIGIYNQRGTVAWQLAG